MPMPRELSGSLRNIAAALQWDRGRWFWLLLIVLFLGAVLSLGDRVTLLLRFDRGGIAAGGWWRLLTAHIVHLDVHHLLLNDLGLVLIWSLFAQDFAAVEWLVIVAAGALCISCGLWWISPGVTWYVGASGVLHAAMAAGAARHLAERAWDRWVLFLGLCVKLIWEQASRQPNGVAAAVIVDAHLYGAIAGFVVGAALSWRLVIIRIRRRA